ncbi:MAG TPA: glycosyltransferase [Puia sp.]|nr:glycosyltransferase [Puia sp.]
MQYAIVAIGSRGDVQPYIALALGLKERGHDATIVAHENFRGYVEGYGIGFLPVKGDVEFMLQSAEGMKMVRDGSLRAFTRYLQKVNRITSESIALDIMSEFKKADVLVASLLAMPWVHAIAEKLGKKWAIVQLNLPATKTIAFPFVLLDFFHFPAYNRFTYVLFNWAYWRANKKNINEFRLLLNLPSLEKSILKIIAEEKILNLHCFSPALLPRPGDWPAEIDITGFLFLPARVQSDIPAELKRWLDNGERPIYIGFGSIPVPDPHLFKSILSSLLAKTSYRFVFCYGWTPPMDLPENKRLFQINAVSHELLLPYCRTAIIHGGVGTTAAVLRAKIPVIITSIIADQPWWGRIIEEKRVGVHIPFKKLTVQKLMTALKTTEGKELRQRAFRLGEQINLEDGLFNTINKLEEYFSGGGR